MAPTAELRATLSELHEQLASADDLDADAVALLRSTLEEIQEVLERSGEEDTSFSDRLEGAAQHFEETHPTLAATVGRVVDQLAKLGI